MRDGRGEKCLAWVGKNVVKRRKKRNARFPANIPQLAFFRYGIQ
jgi:hypothetical protein